MLIKVCGMRDAENIRDVERLGVDLIGFVFYPKSARYVRMVPSRSGLTPDYAGEQSKMTSNYDASNYKKPAYVGVFVDEMPQSIVTRIYNYNLDYVQLHGSESKIMIENLRSTVDPDIHKGIKVIKAISIASKSDIEKYKEYSDVADMILFDTKCDSKGGCGKHFDWSILNDYDGNLPFLIGGGVSIDDIEAIKSINNPHFAGVDVNSCFETSPAVKDINKLKMFVDAIRE